MARMTRTWIVKSAKESERGLLPDIMLPAETVMVVV
jgi:hypothetical protein